MTALLFGGCAYAPVEIGSVLPVPEAIHQIRSAPDPAATPAPDAVTAAEDRRFSVTAQQAREIATAIRLIDAYNAGRLAHVLALLSDNVNWSDCDYESGRAVEFYGKTDVEDWLRQRMAEGDRLTVRRIGNANPEGEHVVAIEYSRRWNETLIQQGFPNGIEPALATKAIFTGDNSSRIRVFANGPVGGDPSPCQPSED